MPEITVQIRPMRSAADLEATVRLFNAYACALGIDLFYQNFAAELATPPGKYGASAGELQTTRFPFPRDRIQTTADKGAWDGRSRPTTAKRAKAETAMARYKESTRNRGSAPGDWQGVGGESPLR